MRVLYHHRTRAEDAQGVHIRAMCEAFEKLGHKVDHIAPVRLKKDSEKTRTQSTQKTGNRLFGVGIPHVAYELLAIGYNIPSFMYLCLRMLLRRPDLVYERYSLFNLSGYLSASLFKVPFVLEVNAPLCLEMQKYDVLVFKRLAQSAERWLCNNAMRTIVVSGVMLRNFQERGVSTERFMVMHNGVDSKKFNTGVSGLDIRQRYGLADRFVVGFVGWMRPWHGVDILLNAISILKEEIKNLRVLLVGDGPAVPALQHKVSELGLDDIVVFTGPVANKKIAQYIAAMDVAVQPDVTLYASPIKLFEYFAVGRAVVAPDTDNIREIVEDGINAMLYRRGDVRQLAGHLRTLYFDTALRARLGLEASKLVKELGFSWESNALRIIRTLEQDQIIKTENRIVDKRGA